MFIIIFILFCKLTTFSRGSLTWAVPVTCIALPSSVTSENKWVEGIAHPAHPPPQKKEPSLSLFLVTNESSLRLCCVSLFTYSVAY